MINPFAGVVTLVVWTIAVAIGDCTLTSDCTNPDLAHKYTVDALLFAGLIPAIAAMFIWRQP